MDFKIITGADNKYIRTLIDFIKNFKKAGIDMDTLVVYDYGLNESNRKVLNLCRSKLNFEIVKFDYSLYPEHVHLENYNGVYCNYAFKVISIYNEANKYKDKKIIWMDSANRFNTNAIQNIISKLKNIGVYSPCSSKPQSIEALELHDHKCIEYFKLNEDKQYLPQRNGALVGIDYSHKNGKYILDAWYKYSLMKHVIMPENSSRNNHRQDQTVLTLIMYLYEKTNKIKFDTEHVNVTYWVKLDKNSIEHIYNKYQITNLHNNIKESLIYCNSYKEAVDIYCRRKLLDKNEFLSKFIIRKI